jgi:hypothetical protein
MPAGSTYTPIATTTLGSSASTVTFNSFSGYTDLVIVISARDSRSADGDGVQICFNSDTSSSGTNYSTTYLDNGPGSARESNARAISFYQIAGNNYASNGYGTLIINIQNYANTTTNKTAIGGGGWAPNYMARSAGLWRNTAAITSLTLYPGFNGSGFTFSTGSTFTLYGIQAA